MSVASTDINVRSVPVIFAKVERKHEETSEAGAKLYRLC